VTFAAVRHPLININCRIIISLILIFGPPVLVFVLPRLVCSSVGFFLFVVFTSFYSVLVFAFVFVFCLSGE